MRTQNIKTTPNKLASAWSGGGAPAFRHIGIIERLNELGVGITDFDIVSGCSAGGLAILPLASGMTPSKLRQIVREEICCPDSLKAVPGGLVAHATRILRGKLKTTIHRHLAGVKLEELRPRTLITSFDLITGRPYIHQQGDVTTALLATTAIPLLAPPVRDNGRVLVDGGCYANLPSWVFSEFAPCDRLIGIDASRRRRRTARSPRQRVVSLWDALVGTLSAQRSQVETVQREKCHLLVRPSSRGCGFLDFSRSNFDRMIAAGRRAADRHFDQIEKVLSGQVSLTTRRAIGRRLGVAS